MKGLAYAGVGLLCLGWVLLGWCFSELRGPLCRCWEEKQALQAGVDARPCPRHGSL